MIISDEKPYISPSQVFSYTRCGEAYRRRYICKEIIPPGIAQVKGTAVHKGAEKNFKQKIETKADLPEKEVVDYAISTLENQIKREGLFLSKEEESVGKKKLVGKAVDSVASTSGLLVREVAPRYQPEAVEETIIIELSESSHNLKGILDLIANGYQVIDIKTSGKKWSQDQADKSGQITFYAMLCKAKSGSLPTKLIVENLVDKKEPERNSIETVRTVEHFQPLINRINAVINGVQKGNFPPASDGAWWCSPDYCGYHATCPYVK